MGSDIARISYDKTRKYDSVVMQQGRVFVEADWNEQQVIAQAELRADVLDIVGPAGTPNSGYIVTLPASTTTPYDFNIAGGTMYVGGVRVDTADTTYFTQPDWIDPPVPSSPASEYIVLHLAEQDVSAVEDQQLKDVALGGPDTSQRRRIIQHIRRYPTTGTDCATALAAQEAVWAKEGLTFNPDTMILASGADLEVSFGKTGSTDPCSPGGEGGYIDPDNQVIRVKVIGPDAVGSNQIVWGYDNASFIYRVDVAAAQTLTLKGQPVDAAHNPQNGQAVEVLYTDVDFGDGVDYIADSCGTVTTLNGNYDPNLQQVKLTDAIQFPPPRTPVFLRMWNSISAFTPDKAVELGNTGVFVTLSSPPFTSGSYWTFAVRPITPQTVYPQRYVSAPQPPTGPREWICPLAVISWTGTTGQRLDNCVISFQNLVELSGQTTSGCCTLTVQPSDLTVDTTLQSIINNIQTTNQDVTVCLLPGRYALPEPLLLGVGNSNLTLEGCGDGVILEPANGAEGKFVHGLILIIGASGVTLSNLEMTMPLVPFRAFGALNTGVAGTTKYDAQLITLDVSLAIRALDATSLTVRDCTFGFRASGERDLFAVGMLCGGDCTGLTIDCNRFESGLAVSSSAKPIRVLIGIMLAPVTVPTTKVGSRSTTNSVLRSVLTDASINNNRFSALSAALYSVADTGSLQIEDNQVSGGYSGFWIIAMEGLATLEALAAGDANGNITEAPDEINLARALVNDTLIQYGASLARSYPLPEQYSPAATGLIAATKNVTSSELASLRLKTFRNTVAVLNPPAATPTPAGAGPAAPPETLSLECPTEPIDLQTYPLYNDVSGTQQWILLPGYKRVTPNIAIAVNDNSVTAIPASGASSSMALFLYETPSDTTGSLIMSANKLENSARRLPTVALLFAARCVVTGNLILNEANERDTVLSLVMYETQDVVGSGVAVTGNVFLGQDRLPARQGGLTSPLDNWNTFNSSI